MRVDIWSDVVCPWCYIGKRRLEDALSRFEPAADVEVVWRAFELNPSAPATYDGDNIDRLARKYGVSRAQAEAMNERVTRIADREGLTFRLDIARPGNTFDAHRLLHLAAERGRQDELKEELLATYQTRGEAIGNREVLVKAAATIGIGESEARAVLESERYGDDVRADERAAQELGVTAVPFFVFDGRYAVSGAQSSDVLLEVLRRAWTDRVPVQVITGNACGPEGCEPPAS